MELRLIVEASAYVTSSHAITLEGRQWLLSKPLDVSDQTSVPNYICISYLWGSGRCPNPFHQGMSMSDQTLPALAAVIRHSSSSAFWIDTFCIPSEQPQRSATLQSMGFIYNLASEVVVCLSGPTFAIIDQMNQSDILTEAQVNILEQDAWISSVWTYQEVLNSRKLRFVSNQHGDAIVDDLLFLNRLGYSLGKYKKLNGLNDFNIRDRFPRLDSFEGLIADWRMLAFTEVTALQVISNIDTRSTNEPKNLFFSMLGAVTKNPAQHDEDSTLAKLSESFMNICEQKNDYSFIYSSTMRDETIGRRWRPRADILHAIIVWQNRETQNQRGYYDSEGFWLEKMIEPSLREELDLAAQAILLERLQLSNQVIDSKIAAQQVYHRLQQMGYIGSNAYVESRHGFFFPQTPIQEHHCLRIFVATAITWVFGAPGIAKIRSREADIFVPGIFVGSIDDDIPLAVLLDGQANHETTTELKPLGR